MTLIITRYLGADLVRSQRFLIPVVTYCSVLAVLFGGDPGPPPTPWGASTFALYPISAWLAITIANTEDPIQRHITIAAAGGWPRIARGILVTALLADAVLVLISLAAPKILGHPYPYSPRDFLIGALSHLASAFAGTAVGLLCARPLINKIGWSFVCALLVLVITAVQRWLPPVGTAVDELSHQPAAGPLALDAAIGLLLAVGATVICTVAGNRR